MKTPNPTEAQLDALREVANVGAGHAARALSQLTGGRRMGMDIPRAQEVDVRQLAELLGGERTPVVAISLKMTGSLEGRLLIVWPEADAELLASTLLGVSGPTNQATGETQSALLEAANIIASACLSAMGQLTGLRLMPSVPSLHSGTAAEISRRALESLGDPALQAGWVLEARLFSDNLSGQLLLVPDPVSMGTLLNQLGV